MNWNMNSNEPLKARGFRSEFVIREYECGLLYRHGKFQGQLEAGRHVRWGRGYALAMVDLRKQTFPVAGQEVLSADNVGLKVSVAVTVRVADPPKAMHEVQDWRGHLYNVVQIALRTLIAATGRSVAHATARSWKATPGGGAAGSDENRDHRSRDGGKGRDVPG